MENLIKIGDLGVPLFFWKHPYTDRSPPKQPKPATTEARHRGVDITRLTDEAQMCLFHIKLWRVWIHLSQHHGNLREKARAHPSPQEIRPKFKGILRDDGG